MAGKFVIITTKNGEFSFNLKASNGEIILTASESYPDEGSCRTGLESVRANAAAATEDQTRGESVEGAKYELYQDKGGEFRFRLKAGNGKIIGKSEGYKAKASAKKGILSVLKNAPLAEVIVQPNLEA